MSVARRLALGLALATLAATPAHLRAQAQMGAIAGATFSTLRGIDGLDTRTSTLGGLSIVTSGGALAWQPELLVVSKGAKQGTTGSTGLKLDYVEIPLLLRISLAPETPVNPHIYAGPYLGLQVSCNVQGTSAGCDDLPGVSTRTVDAGGIAGGGVSLDVGGMMLTGGVRYSFGVSKVADLGVAPARQAAKNGVFAIYAGIGVRLGKR